MDASVRDNFRGAGGRRDFDDLFRHYYPRLKAYAVTMVECKEAAEDIVQDMFLYVWENRQRLYSGGGFHSYLFQSVYTRSLDYLKKHLPSNDLSPLEENQLKEFRSLIDADSSVLEHLYSDDFYKCLYKLLEHLPEQRREVFILYYMEGLKTKEIAEQTQLPPRTVESHLYLSLRFLKKRMSKKEFYLLCLSLGSTVMMVG